jgi:hypothetical protein
LLTIVIQNDLAQKGGIFIAIIIYADATQICSFGGRKFHPILVRFGFIEDLVRRTDGYGGAILVGYMPIVSDVSQQPPAYQLLIGYKGSYSAEREEICLLQKL